MFLNATEYILVSTCYSRTHESVEGIAVPRMDAVEQNIASDENIDQNVASDRNIEENVASDENNMDDGDDDDVSEWISRDILLLAPTGQAARLLGKRAGHTDNAHTLHHV